MAGCSQHSFDRRSILVGAGAAGLAASAFPGAAQTPLPPPPKNRRLIDVHHHVFPSFYLERNSTEVASRSKGFTQALEWTPEKSIADMDAAGTSKAILSMVAPVWLGDNREARELATRANEYARDLKRKHAGRFGYFAVTPMPDVEGAIAEVGRALDRGEADGVGLLTNYQDKYLGDRAFDPLFAELDRRGAVVYVHPMVASCCQNLVPDIAPAFLELPFDSTRTIASLLYSGALNRYRRIRWIFSHGGGTLPFLADRLSAWGSVRKDMANRYPEGAMAELKRLNFDTASVTNAPAMAALGKFVPWSQVMFGTDFPFVPTLPQIGELRRAGLSDTDLAGVEYRNAERLIYGKIG